MAEIRQYVSSESPYADAGGRRASAADFASGANFTEIGQGLGRAADTLMQAQEQQDVSDVHVKLSEARAKWTTNLLERSQTDDVYKPDFADKFTTDFHGDVSAIGDGVSTAAGQRAFRQGIADMTASFAGSAGTYQAQAAGVKAKNDYQTYLNNNQLTLFKAPDQFTSIMAEAQRALNDPAGPYARLQPSVREALARTGANDLAKSAMMGLIDASPEVGKKELEAGTSPLVKALDADTLTALIAHADQGINAQRIDQERARIANERAQKDARDATLNSMITKLVEDPTGVSAKDVINSNLEPSQRIAVLGWIQKGLTGDNGEKDVQNATFNELFSRIHLPDGDPDKITDPDVMNDYVSNGVLDFGQLNTLRGEIAGKGGDQTAEKAMTNAFDGLAEKSLVVKDPYTGFLDPNDQEGNRLLYQFRTWFLTEYPKRRDKGDTPEELLTPGSPKYMGTMIDTLKAQRKTIPGLGAGLDALNTPDAATPGTPASAIDLSKATRTGTFNGKKVYEIDGKTYYADGTEVK